MPLVRKQYGSISGEILFVDDRKAGPDICNGHRVTNYKDWMREDFNERRVALAIANSCIRERIAAKCRADGVGFLDVRATNVIVMDDAVLGEGAILCPFVTITSNVRIGVHFHANLYSYVAHDCVIGDYVTFAPCVKCNGNVKIEDHAYIGTGAVIKQGGAGGPLVIGRGATVGMGAVVTRSVPPGVTVVGNPARPLVTA
jgi:sugar O-acyltransferase (sialic acid O-acetyltransferase NeuD family)